MARESGEPYIKHCREIVEILNTEDMLAAAWLHDVLEDTECSSQTIYREFGFNVVSMVIALTDCHKDIGNRAMRKGIDRRRIG